MKQLAINTMLKFTTLLKVMFEMWPKYVTFMKTTGLRFLGFCFACGIGVAVVVGVVAYITHSPYLFTYPLTVLGGEATVFLIQVHIMFRNWLKGETSI